MKSIIFNLLIIILSLAELTTAQTLKRNLDAYIWNDFWQDFDNIEMTISYDSNIESFLWNIDYVFYPNIAIVLDENTRKTLLEYIKKYKKWNKKASRKKVEIDKLMGVINNVTIYFDLLDTWYKDSDAKIALNFFSQSTQKHQIVIDFNTVKDDKSFLIFIHPQKIYLWWNDVLALEKAISDEKIKSYRKKIMQIQSIESEFK